MYAAVGLHAVGAFFADNLGVVGVFFVGDEDGSAFAHAVVLGLVEAVATEVAEGTERAALVGGHHSLRGIFDDEQVVAVGDFVDGVHLAGDTRIMHGHDGLGLFGDGAFDQLLVEVHGVGADVHEHALGTAHGERVGGTDERERRHDDLVAGLYVAEQRRHLARVGATGGEERPCNARLGF